MKIFKILLFIFIIILSAKISYCQNATALFSEATDLFSDSRYEEAIAIYSNFIDLFPKHNQVINAYYNIGESYYRSMNFVKAEEYFKKVIINFPKTTLAIDARNRLGDSYQKQELFNEAIAEYQKVMEIHPNTLQADYAKYAINWLSGREMPKTLEAKKSTKAEGEKSTEDKKLKSTDNKEKPKKAPIPLSVKSAKKEEKKIKKITLEKVVINLINNISNQDLSKYISQIISSNFNIKIASPPSPKIEKIIDFNSISYFFNLKNKEELSFQEEDKKQTSPLESEITLKAYDIATDSQEGILLKVVNNTNDEVILDKKIIGNRKEINKEISVFIKNLKNLLSKKLTNSK